VTFCIQCGEQNPDDAVFCLGCGQALYRLPKVRRLKLTLVISALLLVTAVVGLALWFEQAHRNAQDKPPTPTQTTKADRAAPNTDSVLTIIALDPKGSTISQGSGFVLTSDGLAGSNYHVLKGAAGALASSADGRIFEVGLIEGVDLDKDLIVFQLYPRGSKAKPHDLPHVTLGSWTDLAVGEKVIAIGSPEGLEDTVSDGILSAIREVDSVRFLQITAPVSPGSSGGPVLDSAGRMIGVATFQLKKGQNLNFAVAVDHVTPLVDQHLELPLPEFRSTVAQIMRERRTTPSETQSEDASTSTATAELGDAALTGQFGGVIHNTSANVSAEFALVVRDDAGRLSGCMLIKEPLFGSGALNGYADAAGISFFVTSAIGKITACGQKTNNKISGTYVVEHDGSRPDEEGTFTLRKISSEGMPIDFDPAKCPTDAEVHK
jgi:S1-C subfamily serine protease